MTKIYAVHLPSKTDIPFERWQGDPKPRMLVSYFYLHTWKNPEKSKHEDWILDSGAFSAVTQNTKIDLVAYTETCLALQKSDKKLTGIFSLDVIGDAKATLINTELMWEQGINAIPTFHFGSSWKHLFELAKKYPRIALGGLVNKKVSRTAKHEWIHQCFQKVFPIRIHGLGVGSKKTLLSFPWHSVDCSSWVAGDKYGMWRSFAPKSGSARIRASCTMENYRTKLNTTKSDKQATDDRLNWLSSELQILISDERRARGKWAKLFKQHGLID